MQYILLPPFLAFYKFLHLFIQQTLISTCFVVRPCSMHWECSKQKILLSQKSESEVTPLCPTLSDPMDCSLPGLFVHGILQARILEWVAISFSGESSQPRDQTQVSNIAGRLFTIWAKLGEMYLIFNWENNHHQTNTLESITWCQAVLNTTKATKME